VRTFCSETRTGGIVCTACRPVVCQCDRNDMNSWNVGKVRTYSCFELCPVHLELQNVNAKQDLKEQQLQNKTDMVPNSYKLYVGKVRTYSYLESCGAGKMSSTFRTGKTSMRNRT